MEAIRLAHAAGVLSTAQADARWLAARAALHPDTPDRCPQFVRACCGQASLCGATGGDIDEGDCRRCEVK